MHGSTGENSDLFDRILNLFLELYCELRQSVEGSEKLEGLSDTQVAIINLIGLQGGKSERPLVWKSLGFPSSSKYDPKIKSLKKRGIVCSPPRTSLATTDVLTDKGNNILEETRQVIKQFAADIFFSMTDEEKRTVSPFIESLEAVIERTKEGDS